MTETEYFSDRENGPRARTEEVIPEVVWAAIWYLIQSRIDDGSFGERFPASCLNGGVPYGTNDNAFWSTVRAEIGDLPEEIHPEELPDTFAILDLLQFSAKHVAKPIQGDFHEHWKHHHLTFERGPGLTNFVSSVNQFFARNGIAFDLTPEGIVQRLGPPGLRNELRQAVFHTGDTETDRLLEDSRRRILSPKSADRYDAVKKLWDAFERIKTLESGSDKKTQVNQLLNNSVPESAPKFRNFLEIESKELSKIGNTLHIRHYETDKEPLHSLEQVDYLFHRLFSLLFFLLRKTDRASRSSE